MASYAPALLGGILIGLASWLLFAGMGRIAGISTISSEAVTMPPSHAYWRWAFLLGLVGGGWWCAAWLGAPVPSVRSPWLLVPAGLLVGVGTVLGSGCTSGHGVCGLGRRSVRSLVAVLTFMATGVATVFVAAYASK